MPRDLSRPLTEVRLTVPSEAEGMRLDHWLRARVPWRSRSDLQRRIRSGRVLLDGKRALKSQRLAAGQEVRIAVDEGPATREVPRDAIPIDVLHEDRWVIALDKAPGTVVHPVGRHVMDTVINALHARHRARDHAPGEQPPMIVHRLDRETSGVLLLAKEEAVRKALGRDFEERRVEKSYLALVAGTLQEDHGEIDRPIGPDQQTEIRIKVACVPDGRPSLTRFEVIARGPRLTLVRCLPQTGRQHQIRVHLASIGHPVLCDRLYGDGRPVSAADLGLEGPGAERVLLARHALHSERLVVTHPVLGTRLALEAPLAADLQTLVRLAPGTVPI